MEVHYEHAAEYPKETYMSIYKFIGLKPASSIDSLVKTMTTKTQKENANFTIFKSIFKTATAYEWQTEMDSATKQHISRECKNVLELLNIPTSL